MSEHYTIIPDGLEPMWAAEVDGWVIGYYKEEQTAINACAKHVKKATQYGWICQVYQVWRDKRKEPKRG